MIMYWIRHICHSPSHKSVDHKRNLKYVSLVMFLGILSFVFGTYICSSSFLLVNPFFLANLQRYKKHCSSPIGQEKIPLVSINGTHSLMVSAYLEHRYPRLKVRVIAIVLCSETVVYHCHLCCDGQTHNVSAKYTLHADHFKFPYGTADIMCPVPNACGWPTHVAVQLSDNFSDPPPPFIPVLNQHNQYDMDPLPINFTVCISTMFDFGNVLQLVQSLEMFRILGVGRVAIYRTSCSPAVQKVLDHYTHSGLVEVIPWAVSSRLNVSKGWLINDAPGDIHYHGQIPALHDCVYRYMYQSRYLALQDIDELILPVVLDNWNELLPHLESKHGANFGYKFKNTVFRNTVSLGDMNKDTSDVPVQWSDVPGVNILDHLYYEPSKSLGNFKVIVNPRAVFVATVHGLLDSERGCVWVNTMDAKLHHTRGPWRSDLSLNELQYDDRILRYASRLVPAVSEVLRKTQLSKEQEG